MTETKRRFRPPGKPRCTGKKLDGTACRSFAHPKAPDQRCANHTQDEEMRAKQRAISVKGGQGVSHLARALRTVASGGYGDLVGRLAVGMDDVLAGRLDPARLSAVAQTARAIVVIADQAQTKERLDRLERRFEEERARRDGVRGRDRDADVVIVYDADGNELPPEDGPPLLETSQPQSWEGPGPVRTDDPPHVKARRNRKPRAAR